jgi:uncharacterized protein YraI
VLDHGERQVPESGRRLRRTRRIAAAAAVAALTSACQSTSIPGLNVRAGPTTHSRVVGTLGHSGTEVRIACFTRGEPVHGDTVWYRITQPRAGYVTNYYIRTNADILATTPSC